MIQFFYRDVLIRTFETGVKRRKTFRYWRELERTQWLSGDELKRIQWDNLKRLLHHAYLKSAYYRRSWTEQGLSPTHLQSVQDFHRWPIIDRTIIREHRIAMRTEAPGTHLIAKSTGGSSGVPLHFDLNPDSNDRRMAAWHRAYRWAGAAPGTKQFYFWGARLGAQPRWKYWKDAAYNGLYRRKVVNCFEYRDSVAPAISKRLSAYQPDVIVAYTNPLYFLARSLNEQGIRPFSPQSIVLGAEKLYDFQRILIESVFQCPVFETYGSREFMSIGAECDRHEGLHLAMEHLLVEVLDDKGLSTSDGEEGNVVITDLYNYGMPFIRYMTGDRAIAGWGRCTCGRGLPMLRKVTGRRLDMLTTPDGRQIPGEFFPHLLKDYPAVRRFQVIQDSADAIQLCLVVSSDWTDADHDSVMQQARAIVGPSARFQLEIVDDISLSPSGKLQVVLNRHLAKDLNEIGAEIV